MRGVLPRIVTGALCFALAGCAARRVALPEDAGTPLPDFAEIHDRIAAACVGVRTLTAELALSGRAGGRSLRGRVIAGFERPGSMRLEGVAPFGSPGFILVARGGDATLLLPRDNRVLRDAAAVDVLGAMTGVSLAPGDILAVLTGCVAAEPRPTGGRRHQNGWASIDLDGGMTVYLEPQDAGWRLRAARRPGWRLEYPLWQTPFPQSVRITSDGPGADVDLTALVSQLETNVDLVAAAFAVEIPSGAVDLTLAELRAAGPLQ